MTVTFLRTALPMVLLALFAARPAAALSLLPATVLAVCPPAIQNASLAQLEKLMSENPDTPRYCYPEVLDNWGPQAVPMLLRLLQHERLAVRLGAVRGIAHLRAAGAPALPALIARHRSLVADLARQEAAHGPGGMDQDTLSMMSALSQAIGVFQTVDASVLPYLEAVFFDPASPLEVRRASVADLWTGDTPAASRLRMLPALLAEEATFPQMRSALASFLVYGRADARFILPQLRASLRWRSGHEMVEPFLAVEDASAGFARVLQLYADAEQGSDMRRAIERGLKERSALPELDWQLSAAARKPALLPAVVELMQTGIDSRRTMDYLATRLDIASEVDSTVRILTALRRPAPQAQPGMLALLRASGKDDLVRRDLLLNAVSATAGQAGIPQRFLLDALQHDLARNQRWKAGGDAPASCLSGKVLAQAAPLAPSYLPMLKRAYADARLPHGRDCVEAMIALIANSASGAGHEFLYEQLLSENSSAHRKRLKWTLTENAAPLLPRIRRDIDGLRGERRADVEALLTGPHTKQFLADYRARVVPDMLTLPWTDADAQDWSAPGTDKKPGKVLACTQLEHTVERVDTLGLRNDELSTWLMQVYAGPCNEARWSARKALRAMVHNEQGKRPLRVRQVKALLALASPGKGHERLEEVQRMFEWSAYEREVNASMTPGVIED